MKSSLLIFTLLTLASCSKNEVTFSDTEWDVKCLKTEAVVTKKCVSAVEKVSDLLIPSAHAQYDAVMQTTMMMNNNLLLATSMDDSCTDKLVTEKKCTQYSVTMKNVTKLSKEEVLKKLTKEEQEVLGL